MRALLLYLRAASLRNKCVCEGERAHAVEGGNIFPALRTSESPSYLRRCCWVKISHSIASLVENVCRPHEDIRRVHTLPDVREEQNVNGCRYLAFRNGLRRLSTYEASQRGERTGK